jgi:hypothetical protein
MKVQIQETLSFSAIQCQVTARTCPSEMASGRQAFDQSRFPASSEIGRKSVVVNRAGRERESRISLPRAPQPSTLGLVQSPLLVFPTAAASAPFTFHPFHIVKTYTRQSHRRRPSSQSQWADMLKTFPVIHIQQPVPRPA